MAVLGGRFEVQNRSNGNFEASGPGFLELRNRVLLHLSEGRVKSHIQDIYRELEARNRVEAAMIAHGQGWIQPDQSELPKPSASQT